MNSVMKITIIWQPVLYTPYRVYILRLYDTGRVSRGYVNPTMASIKRLQSIIVNWKGLNINALNITNNKFYMEITGDYI